MQAAPRRFQIRKPLAALAALALAGCATMVPEREASLPPPAGDNALAAGLRAGPAIAALRLLPPDAAGALDSFALSCRVATSRDDVSGLTRPADWEPACRSAPAWPRGEASRFFETYFEAVQVGSGEAFATGYFEPQIRGSRNRRPGFDVPVYGVPPDLERCWRDDIAAGERTGQPPLSRRTADGRCVQYYSRAEIEDGALDGRAPVIGWAADAVELFFLQIQGSGQLISPEGDVVRIGYANQNGHSYTAIGAPMRQRGLIGEGTGYATSMQGIMEYLRAHPDEGRAIMRENASWIFFTELTGEGPLGSIGVPVRGENSVAVDPRFVPYGAPVFLSTDRPEARGMWVAQDTGGAIKGANRFDTFWGAGERAREIAGGMSARGNAWLLLPRGVLARHRAR